MQNHLIFTGYGISTLIHCGLGAVAPRNDWSFCRNSHTFMEVASSDLYKKKNYENLLCQVLLGMAHLTLNPTLGVGDERALIMWV